MLFYSHVWLVAYFCFQHQCQNNGTCVNGAKNYTCLCEVFWLGDRCEKGRPALVESPNLVFIKGGGFNSGELHCIAD